MRLVYHQGKNFGDAINPIIFKTLLPDFFSGEGDYEFLGIGSILGLKRPQPNTKKVIVFSSGFGGGDSSAYGELPSEDIRNKYDFRCVRGPLTADALGLTKEAAICDGAILLPGVCPKERKKKYKYSYLPHLGSLAFYPQWSEFLKPLDINLIDPRGDVDSILDEISGSEVLMAEAMHGAIIADAYRIPWIPVKTNKTINEFKWRDYTSSMDLTYVPNETKTLFSKSFLEGIMANKLSKFNIKSNFTNKALASSYKIYQNVVTEKQISKRFNEIKISKTYLSRDFIIESKRDQLLEVLHGIHKDYK